MEEKRSPGVTTSDESLVLLARAGDTSAFAELWQRHARSGIRVARQFTSSSDADDLVSEAYVRIYQRVLAGGGPEGAFRPYLYTTIRNLAARWGQSNKSINVDDIGEFEAVVEGEDPAMAALDRTLTVRAFRSLPDRWQSVLWYTEVEGMDPHEVAPMLGISANGVAALSYRAREGLRKAWLQAHISDATATGDCRWTIARLGDHARNGLTARERDRVDEHLGTCAKCSIISEEVDEVGSRLALVMIPLILGGAVGGLFLASMSAPSGAMAAELVTSAMPPAFHTLAVASAPSVATGLVATTVAAPLVGALAIALVISGGLAATSLAAQAPHPVVSTPTAQAAGYPSKVSPSDIPWLVGTTSKAVQGGSAIGVLAPGAGQLVPGIGTLTNSTVNALGGAVDTLVAGVTAPINNLTGLAIGPGPVPPQTAPFGVVGASAAFVLSGTGMPGATVAVQAGGVVYATTTVSPQGTWAVNISALPNGIGPIQLKQTLISLIGVDLLSTPLQVLSNSLGITLTILG